MGHLIPPINRLPPELLALVFESLDKEERVLCGMTRKNWRGLIRKLWPEPKTSPNEILYWAAETGSVPLMKTAKGWGATDFYQTLRSAARGGHIECLKLAKNWGASNFDGALRRAAAHGNIDCLKLLKQWVTTEFDRALRSAASGPPARKRRVTWPCH